MERRTILGLFAHPDDESMGPGGTLAKYAALGHRVAFVTVTDGGAGRLFAERPTDNSELRAIRRRETEAAAKVLGVESLGFLGLPDGGLRESDVLELEERFVEIIRRERADVVLTFHGSGVSYHPDHRVVTLAATGAFLGAGRADWYRSEHVAALAPYRPGKLYHFVVEESAVTLQRKVYVPDAAEITTTIDTREQADTRWRAIEAHDSQRDGPPFRTLYESGAFARESFVRVMPTWRASEGVETDLLAGL